MDAWGYTDHDWRRIRQVIDYIRSFPRARESRGEGAPTLDVEGKEVEAPSAQAVQLGLPLFETEGGIVVEARTP